MSKKKPNGEADAVPTARRDDRDAAAHERLLQTQARLVSLFREVRERPSEELADELAAEAAAWEEAVDGMAAAADSIPDLGDSISRIRARLRERIQSGPTNLPAL